MLPPDLGNLALLVGVGLLAGVGSVLGGILGAAISGMLDALGVKLIYLAAAGLSLVLLARTLADLILG